MVMKKITSVVLAFLVLMSVTACNNSTPSSSVSVNSQSSSETSSQFTYLGDAAELSILVTGDNTPPEDNSVLKEITAKTNVTLKVTYVSSGDVTAKLNTLIAAKTLPDIFRVSSISDGKLLKTNNMLADITEYVKNAPAIQQELSAVLDTHPLNTDGNVYALFSADTAYAQNMSIRTDWLSNLNLDMPTDLDSLYQVLDAFTNNDPDQNGAKDTIGMGASIVSSWNNFTSILGAYGIACSSTGLRPILTEDGTVTTALKHENFLEAVKYFKKLYDNGLMDPDFATIPAMDSYGKLWNGKVGVFDFQCAGTTNNWLSRYTEEVTPTFDFAAIKGPDGVAAQGKQYASYLPAVLISAKCKDPGAAVRVLDYLLSEEGNILVTLGVEGKHFNWVDKEAGTYQMIAPYDDSTTNRNDGVYVYSQYIKPSITTERRTLNEQTKEGVAMVDAMCTIEWPYIYTSFDAQTMYGSNLKTIEKEAFCQLITTKGDIEQEYKDAVARWEVEGGLEWEKGATEAYLSQSN